MNLLIRTQFVTISPLEEKKSNLADIAKGSCPAWRAVKWSSLSKEKGPDDAVRSSADSPSGWTSDVLLCALAVVTVIFFLSVILR